MCITDMETTTLVAGLAGVVGAERWRGGVGAIGEGDTSFGVGGCWKEVILLQQAQELQQK